MVAWDDVYQLEPGNLDVTVTVDPQRFARRYEYDTELLSLLNSFEFLFRVFGSILSKLVA